MNVLAPDTTLFGKYVIRGPLESGGMGDVYNAWQSDLARPVAIKLLRADVASEDTLFQRFRREAEAAASLGHPNIVQVLEFRNEPPEPPMLVMEKLEGRSLRDLLAREKTLTPARATFIALQILSALGAAHDANIVHRDIKPANVFILSTFAVRDFVKVLDFGVAKLLEPTGAKPLTDLGQVLGTVSYMAPEQAKGLSVDGRADLFAVGCILFEAIAGQRPRELGRAGIIEAGTKPCARLLDVAPNVDPLLASVIDRALSLEPAARFPTAKAMASALAPFAPKELIDVGRTAPVELIDVARTVREATVRSAPEGVAPTVTSATLEEAASAGQAATEISMIPPTRVSAPVTAPPRTSYAAPLQAAPPPRQVSMPVPSGARARSSNALIYAVPLVAVVVLVICVGVFLFFGLRARAQERELLARARPATCVFPGTCTGKTKSLGETYLTCAPRSANHYRAGDVVFIGRGKSRNPVTFVSTAPDGHMRVTSAGGVSLDVDPSELHGTYCAP